MRLEQYLTEAKWTKEWYKNMMDTKGKKVYSHTSSDGKWTVVPTGKHPVKGYAHKEKKTFWAINNNDTGQQLPTTFLTLKKAKDYADKL